MQKQKQPEQIQPPPPAVPFPFSKFLSHQWSDLSTLYPTSQQVTELRAVNQVTGTGTTIELTALSTGPDTASMKSERSSNLLANLPLNFPQLV